MRRTLLASVLALTALTPALCDEGQGPADPDATLDGLNLGTYWHGQEVSKRDLAGKVVLVGIYGS